MRLAQLFCAAILVAAVSPAAAEDTWSKTVAFSRSDTTSIKIVEPEGYQVTITIDGKSTTDTVPTVFKAPVADAFYTINVVSPKGAKWADKVEAKRFNVTEVRIKHQAGAEPTKTPNAPAARTFIGSVHNKISTCGKKYNFVVRVELIDGAGKSTTVDVKPGSMGQTSVAAGAYDVRAYIWESNNWTYQTTQKATIEGDNWSATLMCGKGPLEIRMQ